MLNSDAALGQLAGQLRQITCADQIWQWLTVQSPQPLTSTAIQRAWLQQFARLISQIYWRSALDTRIKTTPPAQARMATKYPPLSCGFCHQSPWPLAPCQPSPPQWRHLASLKTLTIRHTPPLQTTALLSHARQTPYPVPVPSVQWIPPSHPTIPRPRWTLIPRATAQQSYQNWWWYVAKSWAACKFQKLKNHRMWWLVFDWSK